MILPRNTILKSIYNSTPHDDWNGFEDLAPVISMNTLSEKELEDYLDGKINFEPKVENDNKIVFSQNPKVKTGNLPAFSQPKPSFNFKFPEASKPQTAPPCELDPSFSKLLNHQKEIAATLIKFFNEKNDDQKKRLLSLFDNLKNSTHGLLEKVTNVSDARTLNYPKEALPKAQSFSNENIQSQLIDFYRQLLSQELSFWEQKIDSEINQSKIQQIKEYYNFLELYSKEKSRQLGLNDENNPPSLFDSLSSFNFNNSSNLDKNQDLNLGFQSANNLPSIDFDKSQVELLLKEIEDLHTAFKNDRKEALRTKTMKR